jgi:hypothetical protein
MSVRLLTSIGNRISPLLPNTARAIHAFEANGGRGRDSFLRVIRSRPGDAPLARRLPPAPGDS